MGRNDSGREGSGREGWCRWTRMRWRWTGRRWLLSVEHLTGEQPDEEPGTRFESRVTDLPGPHAPHSSLRQCCRCWRWRGCCARPPLP